MTIPPLLARRVMRQICEPDSLVEVEGDMEEAFHRWIESRGFSFARRRYWKEVFCLAFWRMARGVRKLREGRPAPGSGTPSPPKGGGWARGRDLLADVRFALRRLSRSPVSSGIAVLLLAVGIGGNATIFAVVDQVLRKAPPLIQEPHQLVGMEWVMDGRVGPDFGYYDFDFYRENGDAFDDVLAYGALAGPRGRRLDGGGGEVAVGVGDQISQAGGWVVSGNYFRVLGVSMGLGSGFSSEVQAHGEDIREVVISHGYWERRYGEDRSILGTPIHLNGVPFQVVGVTPEGFRGINRGEPIPDLFIPILSVEAISPGSSQGLRRFTDNGAPIAARFLRLVARLRPGVDPMAAQAATSVLQARWDAEFTPWAETVYGQTYQVRIRPEFDMASFESELFKRQLFFLWIIVGAVFLIGCGNLVLLLLAKAVDREREMGIRSSLGARRGRVMLQLITESLVLALLGGMVGLGLAYLASGAVGATVSMNFQDRITPDGTAILFTFLLSTLAAILFGTLPAWKLSRVDVAYLIQRPGHRRTRALFRGGLVAFQTALSVLILIVGGLLTRSMQAAQEVDLGFDPEGRLIMGVLLNNSGFDAASRPAFVSAALDRLRDVPGVREVSVMNRIPFLGSSTGTFIAQGTDYAQDGLNVRINMVGPNYFEAMGTDILAGRGFTSHDGPASEWVAVVSQPFADQVWPGENPLGKALLLGQNPLTVVGVAENSVSGSVTEAPRAFVYLPSLVFLTNRQNFLISAEGSAAALIQPVDAALREFNPNLAISPILLSEMVDDQLASFRVWSALVLAIAVVAILLALVGLYGVQSSLVSRQTREIGVQIALGAEASAVVRKVVRRGLVMGGLGVLVGVAVALAFSELIRGTLYGVAPTDPLVLFSMPALLLAACFVASLIPALRASRINPMEALRQD